jgi:hypothetical protein
MAIEKCGVLAVPHALYLFSDALDVMHMPDLDTAHASRIAVKLTSALRTASYL